MLCFHSPSHYKNKIIHRENGKLFSEPIHLSLRLCSLLPFLRFPCTLHLLHQFLVPEMLEVLSVFGWSPTKCWSVKVRKEIMFLHLLLEAFKNCSQACRKTSFKRKNTSAYISSLDLTLWVGKNRWERKACPGECLLLQQSRELVLKRTKVEMREEWQGKNRF